MRASFTDSASALLFSFYRRIAISAFARFGLLAGALAASGGWALALPPNSGLSQSARDQIQALRQEKASWTAAQRKLDSHLIRAVKQSRGEVFAPGAPGLRIGVSEEPNGRVLVDIKAMVTPVLLAAIEEGGGQVVVSVPQYQSVRARLPLAQLETVAGLAEVKFIRLADRAKAHVGRVDTEGSVTHLAVAARSAFGATGAGIKVGVLSDGVGYLTNSQASGDLGPVTILAGQSGSSGAEGTAMLEIIHDLAPDAQLYFATANNGQASFAQNILSLRSNGCDIVIDDTYYFAESPFQDGVIAQAVNTVSARGALCFSSAGNMGNKDAGNSSTWEGDFSSGGSVTIPEDGLIHSFGTATYNQVLEDSPDGADLFWSDPLGGAANDYDLFVLDSTGTSVVDLSDNVQDGTADPYESVSTLNAGDRIVIVQYAGAGRFLHLSAEGAPLSISTSGAIRGHAAAGNALAVAAVDAYAAYPSAFNPTNHVESYSADGPRRVFFNADGTAITPGDFSSTGGVVRQKPDLAAADDVSTFVPGFETFGGTSAAAAHAAGIAALVWSYNHVLSPTQVGTLLTNTVVDLAPAGWDRDAGAGIVMAYPALQSLTGRSPVGIALQPATHSANVGDSATFTIFAVGAPPLSYSWQLNGTPLDGATGTSYTLTNIQFSASGSTISCLVSNAQSMMLSSNAVLTVNPPPANDQCSGAIVISGTTATNAQSTLGATSIGDPVPTGTQLRAGVWYQYTAPSSGQLVVDTIDSDFDTVLSLYVGSCGSLTELASDDESGGDGTSKISYPVAAGTTYYILAGGYQGDYGNLVLHLSVVQPLSNDLCSGAIAVSGISYTNTQNTYAAGSLGDPSPDCVPDLGSGVWYQYTPPFAGLLIVDTEGSDFDTGLGLYAGACGSLVPLACDGGSFFDAAQIRYSVTPGTTYYILAGGYGGEFGDLVFYLALVQPPANDLCSGAIVVSGTGYTNTQSTTTASATGDPSPGCVSDFGNGVWYQFTAPVSGQMIVDTIGSDFDTVLAVYTGSCDSLTEVGCDDESGGNYTSKITLPVTAGTTYYIQAGGYDADSGNLVFHLNLALPPTIVTQPAGGTVPAGANVTLTVTAAGPGPLSYQWRLGGSSLVGATGSSYNIPHADQTSSGSYSVVVSNPYGSVTSSNAVLTVISPAFNDTCASPWSFDTNYTAMTYEMYTTNATTYGDPLPACVTNLGSTVWFSYTAPSTAVLGLDTAASAFNTGLAVYTGTCGSLIPVACDDGSGSNGKARLVMPVTAGTTYYIMAGGIGGATGRLDVFYTFGTAPAILSQPTNLTVAAGASATFSVTASGSGYLDYQWLKNGAPIPSAYSSTYTIYSAQSTDAGGYSVVINNSLGSVTSAVATLTVTGTSTSVANDQCSGAIVASGFFYTNTQSTLGATSTGDPSPSCGGSFGKGVWYQYTPPASGQLVVDTIGSSFDTLLALYSGSCGSLTSLACDDQSGGANTSKLTNSVTAGITYYILAGGWASASGNLILHLALTPSNTPDHFAWNTIASPQQANSSFGVTVTAQDANNVTVTGFSGTANLTASIPGGTVTNAILGGVNFTGANPDSGYTDGYAFTPNADLQVTHVRYMYGGKISIWTDTGVLLTSQNVTSVPDVWSETPLATPITLTNGAHYRIGAYYPSNTLTYWTTTTFPVTFANGTIDKAYWSSGDQMPANSGSYLYMVGLRYTAAGRTPVSIAPTVSGSFANGVWTGNVTVLQAATNVVLQAADIFGHSGASNPFNVASVSAPTKPSFAPGSLKVANGQFQFTLSGTSGSTYEIQVSSDLQSWTVLTSVTISPASSAGSVTDTNAVTGKRYYRARLLQ